MFTSILFTAVLATSSALLSQAMVEPNAPGPNETFTEGQNCHIGWAGDTSSPTTWQNMAIELMTGSNEAMVHLTTVATGQDGTKDGTFDYTCPQVTPNSPIYFYQFTAPATHNVTWVTRFTIAAADGSVTPATETEQSNGQTVPWGTGALADPSTAIPPPAFDTGLNSVAGASPSGVLTSGASPSGSGAPLPSAPLPSAPLPSAPLPSAATTPSTKPSGILSSSSGDSAASTSSAPQASGTNAAARPAAIDMRVWPIVAALAASAMTATILL